MPYIFVEELAEGQEEAAVIERKEYDQLKADYDELGKKRDELTESIEKLGNENKGLQQNLDDAKRKFADSFLSSQEPKKKQEKDEPDYVAATIDSIF